MKFDNCSSNLFAFLSQWHSRRHFCWHFWNELLGFSIEWNSHGWTNHPIPTNNWIWRDHLLLELLMKIELLLVVIVEGRIDGISCVWINDGRRHIRKHHWRAWRWWTLIISMLGRNKSWQRLLRWRVAYHHWWFSAW